MMSKAGGSHRLTQLHVSSRTMLSSDGVLGVLHRPHVFGMNESCANNDHKSHNSEWET